MGADRDVLSDRCVSALVPQAAIDAAVLAASKPAHDDGHTDCFYAGILLAAWPHLNAHRPSEVALEKSLDHPTWVVHLSKRERAFDDRIAWAEPRVPLMSPPRVPEAAQSMAYEIDRLRAEVTHLKEEQISLVGSLGDAQAEVERLREAARETLGAIEDRWDGTEKSPLWGLGDALETALETDEDGAS